MPNLGTILSTSNVKPRVTISVTPGATPAVAVTSNSDGFAAWTAGEAEALAISGAHTAGDYLTMLITNDAVLPRVITFGTGFVSSGIVTGVASKTSCVEFVSNGTNFIEASRVVGI